MLSAFSSAYKPNFADEQTAWIERSYELASWAGERLIVRQDRWGGYRVGQDGEVKPVFLPRYRRKKNKEFLGATRLVWHFSVTHREELIGTMSISPHNQCLWGCLHITAHNQSGADCTSALSYYDALIGEGWRPLLTTWSDTGEHYLVLLLRSLTESWKVHAYMEALASQYLRRGLQTIPDALPGQPRLSARYKGDILPLPGRHPTLPTYSQVWDGESWLDGQEAIDYMLGLPGDTPDLLNYVPTSPEPQSTITLPQLCTHFETHWHRNADAPASGAPLGSAQASTSTEENACPLAPVLNEASTQDKACTYPLAPPVTSGAVLSNAATIPSSLTTAERCLNHEANAHGAGSCAPQNIAPTFGAVLDLSQLETCLVENAKESDDSNNRFNDEIRKMNWSVIATCIESGDLPEATKGWSWPAKKIVRLCELLQRRDMKSPFFLSCWFTGLKIKVGRMTVRRTLERLCKEGLLELVSKGSKKTGQASYYWCRWIDWHQL